MSARLLLALALGAPSHVAAAPWAVIAAGSKGYWNYRHQADACHAYQVIKAKGVPEENIITMMYDDIATDDTNPIPGKLFNEPDPNGKGEDVYAGCNIDYRGDAVNVDTFIGILNGTGSGKVLKSTSEDNVFITFIDHGSPGFVAFPDTEMHKDQLQATLAVMSKQKMFKHLIFYLEACESGSMFEGLDVEDVYAVTAANADESSWGTYCGDEANVNGTPMYTCLGDLFTVNWLHNLETNDITQEDLSTQFDAVQLETNKSHVLNFGDKSFLNEKLSDFFGSSTGDLQSIVTRRRKHKHPTHSVRARQVDLARLYDAYAGTEAVWQSSQRMGVATNMQYVLQAQFAAESTYFKLAQLAYPGDEKAQHRVRQLKHKPMFKACEMEAHEAIRTNCADKFNANEGFALMFHQVVVNICHDIAQKGLNLDIRAAAMQACDKEPVLTFTGKDKRWLVKKTEVVV